MRKTKILTLKGVTKWSIQAKYLPDFCLIDFDDFFRWRTQLQFHQKIKKKEYHIHKINETREYNSTLDILK